MKAMTDCVTAMFFRTGSVSQAVSKREKWFANCVQIGQLLVVARPETGQFAGRLDVTKQNVSHPLPFGAWQYMTFMTTESAV